MTIKKVTIYGERCSGTNYLEKLLITNFNVEITWEYGWKHFFGFTNLTNLDDVLFIGIVRNLKDWLNSLYTIPHHIPKELCKDVDSFLSKEFYSIKGNKELMNDRNIETNERYKNIFELRHIKNKFLVETMPTQVKNYLLITYDNLLENFNDVMEQIKKHNLQVKPNIRFPLNIGTKVTPSGNISCEKFLKKERNKITNDMIINKANLYYEKILFPNSDLFN